MSDVHFYTIFLLLPANAWPVTAVADESELRFLRQDKTSIVKMHILNTENQQLRLKAVSGSVYLR